MLRKKIIDVNEMDFKKKPKKMNKDASDAMDSDEIKTELNSYLEKYHRPPKIKFDFLKINMESD